MNATTKTRDAALMDLARKVLDLTFHHDAFRPGQEDVVRAILTGRDVLAVMPTGSGKSVCYQLPATRPGNLTLVISPLRALMRDQVQALRRLGIAAALIDSGVTPTQRRQIYAQAKAGALRLLYVAPERLQAPDFQDFAHHTPIHTVTVDEAHCVLQWGHDFRSSYMRIGEFIRTLPLRPVIAAFTATATPAQLPEIAASLGLRDPLDVTTGFDRPNIRFEARQAHGGLRAAIITRHAQANPGSGIVYCTTIRECDAMAERLKDAGIDAAAFYAPMPDKDKARVQDGFLAGSPRVICATTAFGMGVDKPDIRWVINDGAPDSIETFYQEAGRAGRDGRPALNLLLWDGDEFQWMLDRIDQNAGSALKDPAAQDKARQAARDRLGAMESYCQAGDTGRCLRANLLAYFGQPPARKDCGNCSSCAGRRTPQSTASGRVTSRKNEGGRPRKQRIRRGRPVPTWPDKPDDDPITANRMAIIVDYIRETQRTIGHTYGRGKIADALLGDPGHLKGTGLKDIPGYGSLQGATKQEITHVIRHMLDTGRLETGEHNTLHLPADE